MRLMRCATVCAALALAAGAPVDVFVAGDAAARGVLQWRIPALVRTPRGTLLAFAEARTDPRTDCGPKWIAVRRSVDNGSTWSLDAPVGGAPSSPLLAAGNPQAVFHAPSGRVVLTFGGKDLARGGGCSPGDGVFVVDDGGSDGAAWGIPRNISADLGGAAAWGGVVPGPGPGAVLTRAPHAGRILMSGSKGAYNADVVFFSDDAGVTWAPSNALPRMDESNLAELSDGSVYITLRNAECACQYFALSHDGGATFSAPAPDAALPSPACQASVAATRDGVLFFSNPAATRARANTTIRRTVGPATGAAGGVAWLPGGLIVAPGIAWGGYSSLVIDDAAGRGGILFERNDTAGNVISFETFALNF